MPTYWDFWAAVQAVKHLIERWWWFVTDGGQNPDDWP